MELSKSLSSQSKHYQLINNVLSNYEEYHIATENEYEDIHNILENEAMDLSGFVKLKYTRKPDLYGSYVESGQLPAIITDEQKRFLGVVSEVSIRKYGHSQKSYYTSDLRIAKSAGMRTRAKFREAYLEVLKMLPGECYTVVLKDNEKAIKALTRNKDLYYHKVYEYTSRSILVLPSLGFITLNKEVRDLKIEPANSLAFSYINDKIKFSEFSHSVDFSDNEYVIKNSDQIVGYFSMKKPQSRNLFVEPSNPRINLWLRAIKLLLSYDYREKIPWNYMTNFIIDDDLNKAEVLKMILKFLYKKGQIKKGELFLMCHGHDEKLSLKLPTPQFKTNGCLFKVSQKSEFKELTGPIYLNPLYL